MLDLGLRVSIHADDPAYFGGYVARNYEETAAALGLTDAQVSTLARNSFDVAFLDGGRARRPSPGDRRVRRVDLRTGTGPKPLCRSSSAAGLKPGVRRAELVVIG